MSQSRRLITIATIGCAILTMAATTDAAQKKPVWDSQASPSLASLQAAADQGRYAFVFFWKENDEQTKRMFDVLNATTATMPQGVHVIGVSVTDQREQKTVELFGAGKAPLPLIAAVAPNGAVTNAWKMEVRAEQLQEGFVTDCTAQCLKAVQNNKVVVLCIKNETSPNGAASLQAAAGFQSDPRFASRTEIIVVNPTDSREASFLKTLQVDPQSRDAVTILIAPSGRPVARFAGPVTAEEIIAKATAPPPERRAVGKAAPATANSSPQNKPAK